MAIAYARESADVAIVYLPRKSPTRTNLAPIYVLLASSQASYITGQIYGAMGGEGQP